MKKHLFTILITLSSVILFGQSIPNGGFESWTTLTYENPTGYETSNLKGGNGAVGPINALKTTDAYTGNFAIQLTTAAFGIDTSFAFFSNGDPGKNPPRGGMPYNQTPSGIKLHYKSNIMPGDSSLILVMFKKNGVLIGQYAWAITSSQSSYTLFQKTFSPALSMAPDTVLIGVASSFPFGGNRGIPGNMLQVDNISFTGVGSQPIGFNGDLELWQTINNSQIVKWNINGSNQGGNYQTTDAYSGSYALELQTQTPSFGGGNNGVNSSFATSGNFTNNGPPNGGYPYNKQIDTLVFYYKYLPADPNDSANVNIAFKLNGNNYWGIMKYLHTAGGYQMAQMPFSVPVFAPDSIIINMSSSSYSTNPLPNSYIGSDLKIDNMYFKSQKLPVANFSLPAAGCVLQPVQLTDNSANMVSGWNWIMPGGTPSSSTLQNPQVTYANTGTKTITLYATNVIGSTNTSAAYSRTIAVYSVPVVNATSATICGGSTATLTATGAAGYAWSSGQTGASIIVTPATSTNYTVTGTTNGCSNSAISSVIIPATTIPNICMVTIDSVFANNIVFWDKMVTNKIDSFIIYREVSTNIYKRIGAQHYSALSRFIDTTRSVGPANGNPNVTSYRYKLQLRDSCGNYSALSPYHNCFYFTTVSSGNFIWNSYSIEGQAATPVSTCNLLRDNFGTNTWTVAGSCAGTQTNINDPAAASYPNAVWRIDGLGFNCNPTYKAIQTFNKSKSNVKNNFNVGGLPTSIKVNELNSVVSLSPNPAITELLISFKEEIKANTKIVITDVLGKVISSFELNEGTASSISVNEFPNGIYFVKIQQGKNTSVKKFVKG
ncbi:MAG: T9SS type A sorting domain-containing protein [Burkholderiales bacterium]|nr:T9SS type A sorting domain-containing protein [Bacteroidia bacterium]